MNKCPHLMHIQYWIHGGLVCKYVCKNVDHTFYMIRCIFFIFKHILLGETTIKTYSKCLRKIIAY